MMRSLVIRLSLVPLMKMAVEAKLRLPHQLIAAVEPQVAVLLAQVADQRRNRKPNWNSWQENYMSAYGSDSAASCWTTANVRALPSIG